MRAREIDDSTRASSLELLTEPIESLAHLPFGGREVAEQERDLSPREVRGINMQVALASIDARQAAGRARRSCGQLAELAQHEIVQDPFRARAREIPCALEDHLQGGTLVQGADRAANPARDRARGSELDAVPCG